MTYSYLLTAKITPAVNKSLQFLHAITYTMEHPTTSQKMKSNFLKKNVNHHFNFLFLSFPASKYSYIPFTFLLISFSYIYKVYSYIRNCNCPKFVGIVI